MANRDAYVLRARLVGWPGVTRTIAVRGDQSLVRLHDALQDAFGWEDDHLYSFWTSGKFWDGYDCEYTRPVLAEDGQRTARVRVQTLRLAVGQKLAYLFDFGDEWRVMLTLTKIIPADDGAYPRILASRGEAPPQYPDYEDELDEVA